MSAATIQKERDKRIDFLRFIGLSMIILAHCGPNILIFNLRNFDVPLMVLISGASYYFSFKNEKLSIYIWKRLKRLLFPVWIFLTIYFLILSLLSGTFPPISFKTMISSYLLFSGIGYVWIIRIFLITALVAPFLFNFNKKINSHLLFFAIIICISIIYELLVILNKSQIDTIPGRLIEEVLLYAIPYIIIFSIGIRLSLLKNNHIIQISFLCMAVYVVLISYHWIISGNFVSTNLYKYPPTIYYLSYALFISCLLWLISNIKLFNILDKLNFMPIILFIAQNSIWIYLWHILFVKLIHLNFYFKYPLVYLFAALITFCQMFILNKLVLPKISNITTRKNISMILTG